jgi:hypothetical protein
MTTSYLLSVICYPNFVQITKDYLLAIWIANNDNDWSNKCLFKLFRNFKKNCVQFVRIMISDLVFLGQNHNKNIKDNYYWYSLSSNEMLSKIQIKWYLHLKKKIWKFK